MFTGYIDFVNFSGNTDKRKCVAIDGNPSLSNDCF